ncbi:MAG: hypothetical protein QM626_10395 [Microbacterium sp.]
MASAFLLAKTLATNAESASFGADAAGQQAVLASILSMSSAGNVTG